MICPICKKPVNPADKLAPFCSDRCKLLDLGAWASGDYIISTEPLFDLEKDQGNGE
jgi:endogenous inhibitor of DNA gyrase (YacG/DUF329 family)